MPHQCVRCDTLYEDGSKELLQGCPCGARLFFFINKKKLEQKQEADEPVVKLTEKAKKELESDVMGLIDKKETSAPVVLDLEAIRVLKPGKYELDLVHLFKGEPLIFKLADGKYIIDIPETFARMRKNK